MIGQRKIFNAHKTLHALDNSIRLRIIKVLKDKPRNRSELAAFFCVPALSSHLDHLIDVGLITSERTHDNTNYYLNVERLKQINIAVKKFSKK